MVGNRFCRGYGLMDGGCGARRSAGGVEYTLTRRRVRNINLRVRPDGTVAVSAPRSVPARVVDDFVADRVCWIQSARARMADREEARAAEPPLPGRDEALARMTALCQKWYPVFAASCPGGAMPRVRVRDMTTRWGSCSLKTGTLCFARRLCVMSPAAQEYVVVHEFCHFAHPDHSPAFWAAVAAALPDFETGRRQLWGR